MIMIIILILKTLQIGKSFLHNLHSSKNQNRALNSQLARRKSAYKHKKAHYYKTLF